MKHGLGRKNNDHSYLTDDGNEDKKAKGEKRCAATWKLKFEKL